MDELVEELLVAEEGGCARHPGARLMGSCSRNGCVQMNRVEVFGILSQYRQKGNIRLQ